MCGIDDEDTYQENTVYLLYIRIPTEPVTLMVVSFPYFWLVIDDYESVNQTLRMNFLHGFWKPSRGHTPF